MYSPFNKKFCGKSPLKALTGEEEDPKIKTEKIQEVDLGTVKSKKSKSVKNPFYGLDPKKVYVRGAGGKRLAGTRDAKMVNQATIQPGKLKELKKKYTR
tara:strand:- start:266 stop:562 length:297 start_codon:yes stop_codon:yes gene_type:complete